MDIRSGREVSEREAIGTIDRDSEHRETVGWAPGGW